MFTLRFKGSRGRPSRPACAVASSPDGSARSCWVARIAVLSTLLALGLPGASSAQAFGTMRVTARVVSASVAWAGLAEAETAARAGALQRPGQRFTRRNDMLQARAEIQSSAGPPLLLVTIHHPYN